MADHVPLTVTAVLATGVAHTTPWGLALDGILASQMWDDYKATHPGYTRAMDSLAPPPDLDLPLDRCQPIDGPWHWACTCAWPGPTPDLDVHTWTATTDPRALEQLASKLPMHLPRRNGRYMSRRMPVMVTSTPQLVWQAVGDIDKIRELLTPITWIGKKRSSGEGQVLSWSVTPSPIEPIYAAHLHPDGSLGRPTPASCYTALKSPPAAGYGTAGIRAPYMHLARQHELHLPV